jgi:hypothetical protein
VPYRQNVDRVGGDTVEQPIGEILEGGHEDASPLRNLWRAERKFSEAALDRSKRRSKAARDWGQ